MKQRAVILISGTGSNMLRLVELAQNGDLPIEINAVISDRPTAKGLASAAAWGIPTKVLSPSAFTHREQFDQALSTLIDEAQPQWVLLAGFMRILSAPFTQHYAGRLLNIHPSVLPKFPGLHTHERAIAAGEAEHGASVHFVTEELDGGPVIMQVRVPILKGDTAPVLAKRVLTEEHRLYPEAVRLVTSGRVTLQGNVAYCDGQPMASSLQLKPLDTV